MNTLASSTGYTDDPLIRQARRRVKLRVGFLVHALVFTLVNLGLFALHAGAGSPRGLTLPIGGWSVGLAIHGIVVLARLHAHGLRDRMVAREVDRLRARA